MNPQPKENIMNRTYAIPAAIALTLHALLFAGSGKPPTHPPTKKVVATEEEPPKPLEEDIYQKAVELMKEEVAAITNPTEKPGGGSTEEPPPGVREILRPEGSTDPWKITQDPSRVKIGKGDKIPPGIHGFGPGDGDGPGVSAITAGMLDNPPSTRFQKEPVYPHAMKIAGTTGTVWVEFVVDENGRVHDVHVVKSTNPGFDDATVAAVSAWRFEPGKRKGLPVRFRMSIPIVFNLND
jgi:periplasmic protein TonB